jgi:hypothetical protein
MELWVISGLLIEVALALVFLSAVLYAFQREERRRSASNGRVRKNIERGLGKMERVA